MAEKRTPENNWNQTEEQLKTLVHHYVDCRKTIQQASFHAGMSATLAGTILKHKGLTRSPYDRAPHPWKNEVGAAVAKRNAET